MFHWRLFPAPKSKPKLLFSSSFIFSRSQQRNSLRSLSSSSSSPSHLCPPQNHQSKKDQRLQFRITEEQKPPKARRSLLQEGMDEAEASKLTTVEERKEVVGSMIEVWWPADEEFYKAIIESYNPDTGRHKIAYIDGDVERLKLNRERWRFVNEKKGNINDLLDPDSSSEMPLKKKKKIKGNYLDSSSKAAQTTKANTSAAHAERGKKGISSSSKSKSKDNPSKARVPQMAPTDETPSTSRKMKSYVKVTKTITLGVAFKKKNKKTIENVKERLCEMEDIETNLQKALFTEKNFENDQVLDYERKDGSSVRMSLHLGVGMQIYMKVPWSAKEIPLDVHSWDTISDVKIKFQDKEGTPANKLTLFYDGKQLDNLQTLASYDIENHSALDAISLGEEKIVISVCSPNKDPIEVMVKLCSKVINLKRMIHCMIRCGVERQNLTFKGVLLENSKRLADFKIQMGSVIDLDFISRTNGMKIFVKTLYGTTHTIYVDSSDTVHHLKTVLKYLDGTPVERQRLIFAGRQLEDSRTLGDYGIQEEWVLHMILRLCGC